MTIANIKVLSGLVVSLSFLFSSPAYSARWTVSADEKSGLPTLTTGGVAAVSSNFVFWGKGWSWAGLSQEFNVNAPFDYSITGKSDALKLSLDGTSRETDQSAARLGIQLERCRCHAGRNRRGHVFQSKPAGVCWRAWGAGASSQ